MKKYAILPVLFVAVRVFADPLVQEAEAFLSAFNLNPMESMVRPELVSPIPPSPIVATNGSELVYFTYPPIPSNDLWSDCWPMRLRIFKKNESGAVSMLGQAFLPRQATNTLSVLFSPIVNTSLSVEATIQCWNLQQTTNGVLFVRYPVYGQTNGIPSASFLAKGGVSCLLRSGDTTNLCEWADFVCSSLIERLQAPARGTIHDDAVSFAVY